MVGLVCPILMKGIWEQGPQETSLGILIQFLGKRSLIRMEALAVVVEEGVNPLDTPNPITSLPANIVDQLTRGVSSIQEGCSPKQSIRVPS